MALKQMVLDGVTSGEIAEEVGRRLRAQQHAVGNKEGSEAPASAQNAASAADKPKTEDSLQAMSGEKHLVAENLPSYVQQDNLFGAGATSQEAPKTTD